MTVAWLEKHEAMLRLIYRGAVITLLAMCWWELRTWYHPSYRIELEHIEQLLEWIGNRLPPRP